MPKGGTLDGQVSRFKWLIALLSQVVLRGGVQFIRMASLPGRTCWRQRRPTSSWCGHCSTSVVCRVPMGLAELTYLLDHMTDALATPDAHFDCIHMLSDNHWATLRSEIASRPPTWREAFAYVLSHGPEDNALPLLSALLRDPHRNVAQQAALSLVDLVDLFPEIQLPVADVAVMRLIATDATNNLGDLRAFLQSLPPRNN